MLGEKTQAELPLEFFGTHMYGDGRGQGGAYSAGTPQGPVTLPSSLQPRIEVSGPLPSA
jgi:hypothetical protein